MNPFRLIGDGLHVLAILILLHRFYKLRNAIGISGKTQILLFATYVARYTDLTTNFVSVYNTSLKVFYLLVSYLIVHLVHYKFKTTKEGSETDCFNLWVLVVPVTALSALVVHEWTAMEILWTWSIYMESVALIPQLYLIWKTKKSDHFILLYLLCMALYRGFYIFNWIYRYMDESYYDLIAIVAGVIETGVGLFGLNCVLPLLAETDKKRNFTYIPPVIVNPFPQGKGSEKCEYQPVPLSPSPPQQKGTTAPIVNV